MQILAHSWDLMQTHVVYDPAQDVEGMPLHNPRARGGAIFWEVGVSGYSGVMSWTLAGGTRPLLRWYGDWTQGAGNFNTDGVDMVWTYGEGKPATSAQDYPKLSVMTAPFETDPAKLKPRRLRSDLWKLTPFGFGVGCGYAGRQVYTPVGDGEWSADLYVIRLSDGVAWLISPDTPKTGTSFSHSVLGFTCDEVFATAQFLDDTISIVRIRLDSLGPGLPPD